MNIVRDTRYSKPNADGKALCAQCSESLWRAIETVLDKWPACGCRRITHELRRRRLADGLISRTVFAEVPLRVEYEMTRKARGLGPTMEALTAWWNEYGKSVPAKPNMRGRKSRGRKST